MEKTASRTLAVAGRYPGPSTVFRFRPPRAPAMIRMKTPVGNGRFVTNVEVNGFYSIKNGEKEAHCGPLFFTYS